jgi:glc operon protein GlcG
MTNPAPAPSLIPYGLPIDLETAKRVAAAAGKEADGNGWPVVIAIVDSGANLVLLHRHDLAQLGSIAIAQGKAMTAVKMKRATKLLDDAVTGGGAGLRVLALDGIVPMEGGVPLLRDGAIIGAIGVSGVTSPQDGLIAAAGAKALTNPEV